MRKKTTEETPSAPELLSPAEPAELESAVLEPAEPLALPRLPARRRLIAS